MTPGDIDVVAQADDLAAIMSQHGLDAANLLLVDNIQSWCKAQGIDEPNPCRAGKTLYRSSPPHALILLPKVITRDMAESVISSLMFRDYALARRLSENNQGFLRHLLLHEICHALHRDRGEAECDAWAANELKNLGS